MNPVLACSEIGVIHAMGKAGINVHCGSYFEDNPALYSKFTKERVMFSTYEDEQYIEELIEYGKKQPQKPVYLSDDDRAILLFSEHRERLEPYFHFLFPSKEMVRSLLDKRKFCDLSREKDLPAPISFYCTDKEDFEKIKGEVPFPCILKPAFKQDWWREEFISRYQSYKKAIKCNTYEEMVELYEFLSTFQPRVIIQEYVPGEDANLYSLNMYVNEDSELKGIYLAQKRRIYPIGAGTGCYVVTVKDKEIVNTTIDIVRKLKLRGLVNVQFKKNADTGEINIMEIHLRNSFWNYLGVAAGLNLGAMYYMDLTGKETRYKFPETPDTYEDGVKLFDFGKDLKSFFQYRKKGLLTFREWVREYKGNYVIQGHLKEDMLPVLKNLQFMTMRRLKG
ncbi:hypothetical protein AB2B38_010935 [Balneola sp. MJW-20]